LIVGDLEVNESDITDFLCNGTISAILPSCKVIEVGGNDRILMPWVCGVSSIKDDRLARIFSRDHVMEDS